MKLSELEELIDYQFKDKNLLRTAMTHSSAVNEQKTASNQRLEFLGDAVLQLSISNHIYRLLKEENEGVLSKLRSLIVCSDSLYKAAVTIQLSEFLILGKGEEISGGRGKKNIVADAMEALIGAVYLDGGYKYADVFVQRLLGEIIDTARNGQLQYDYKTTLQEYVQSQNLGELGYELVKISGPEHAQIFTSRVRIGDDRYAGAKGQNRKQSEQNAAELVLRKWKVIE